MPITNNNYTQTGTKENRFLYQGKEWQTDLALNLYDFHARQYDPATGRFTSSDRLAGLTPGWTPYHGMGNNPMLHTDPTGEVLPAVAVAAIIGAAIGGGTYTASVAFSDGGFDNWNWGQFGLAVGIGAASGYVGGGVSQALTPLGQSIGFGAGVAGGAAGGAIGGAGSAAIAGQNVLNGAWQGALGGAIGGGVGTFFQGGHGVWNGAAFGAIEGSIGGGLYAGISGGNVLDGLKYGALYGGAGGAVAGGIGAYFDNRKVFSGKKLEYYAGKEHNGSLSSARKIIANAEDANKDYPDVYMDAKKYPPKNNNFQALELKNGTVIVDNHRINNYRSQTKLNIQRNRHGQARVKIGRFWKKISGIARTAHSFSSVRVNGHWQTRTPAYLTQYSEIHYKYITGGKWF